jgi:hypothetical protein
MFRLGVIGRGCRLTKFIGIFGRGRYISAGKVERVRGMGYGECRSISETLKFLEGDRHV